MTNAKRQLLKVVPKTTGVRLQHIAIEIHESTIALREHYTFKGKVAGACLLFTSSFRKRVIKYEQTRSLLNTIKDRQRKWIGHILRHDNMMRDMIEGRVDGKRMRGGQRTKMLDMIMNGNTYKATKIKAQDRNEWWKMDFFYNGHVTPT